MRKLLIINTCFVYKQNIDRILLIMEKIKFYRPLLAVMVIMLASCFSSQAVAQKGVDVDFDQVGGYFVPDDVKDGTLKLVIKSQKDLDRVLHLALVGGYIPPIDFDRYFMIAVVVPKAIAQATVKPVALKRNGNKLFFSYSIDFNNRSGVANRSYAAVLVDRKELAKVEFQEVSQTNKIQQNESGNDKSLRQQLEYIKAENLQLKERANELSAENEQLRTERVGLIQRLKALEEENKRLEKLLHR